MAKTIPPTVIMPPKQTIDGNIPIDNGLVSIAVIHRLIASKTKQINETSKVLREIKPLDVNKKLDMNRSIPKIILRNSKI